MSRRNVLAGLATALAVVALSGCSAGASDDPTVDAPSAAPSPVASLFAGARSPSSSPSPAPADAPGPRVIAVRFAGGRVTGVESRVPAALGEQLLLRIASDVADEVHVHGYDLKADVPAGGTVEIPLTATISGSVEVELEERGKTLFQLRVQ